MNCIFSKNKPTALALALAAAMAPAGAFAVTYDLCATSGSVTMPDSQVVPIWGYVLGTSCAPGDATLPGPTLDVPAGDTSLTINLHNQLGVATSVFIPGQVKPLSPVGGTTTGSRVSSFDATAPAGGSASYTWSVKPGTFLYQSGTDVRTQIPMGMYGALVVHAGASEAYPGVSYDSEEVLLFSEIDPNLNADPAGFGGARVSGYIDATTWQPKWQPKYFMINGKAYDPANPAIPIGVSTKVLLRMLNAGLQTFVPTLQGLDMNILAEDGNPYPYPLTQYGVALPAAKTMDAMVNAGTPGRYALYDRALHVFNGGMVTYLEASAVTSAPLAADDAYAIDEDTLLTADGVAPNPAGVLANDSGSGTLVAELVSAPVNGSLTLNGDGSFSYTPAANYNGPDQFSYRASDGVGGPSSNVASVAITVNPVNDAPVAAVDSYDAIEGQLLTVAAPGVLVNDSDIEGDALTAALASAAVVTVDADASATSAGNLLLSADGSFTLDLAGSGLNAGDAVSFSYTAADGMATSAATTVTVNVVAAPPPPANTAPVAVDDYASTNRNTATSIPVTANDYDSDGTIDPASIVLTSGGTTNRGGTVSANPDGSVSYQPKNGFRGTDSFRYTVNDNAGATSNEATVRINVVK